MLKSDFRREDFEFFMAPPSSKSLFALLMSFFERELIGIGGSGGENVVDDLAIKALHEIIW